MGLFFISMIAAVVLFLFAAAPSLLYVGRIDKRWTLLFLALSLFPISKVDCKPPNAAKAVQHEEDWITRPRSRLGALRSALTIYLGDTGHYPADLSLLVPKCIDAIHTLELPHHLKTNKVVIVTKAKGRSPQPYLKDTGGWLYFAGPETGDLEGTVAIDCKHKDAEGVVWGTR